MTKPDSPGSGRKYSARDIARIFGDVLPAQTKDDLDAGVDGAAPGSGAASRVAGGDGGVRGDGGDRTERWYRENRPPHHGG